MGVGVDAVYREACGRLPATFAAWAGHSPLAYHARRIVVPIAPFEAPFIVALTSKIAPYRAEWPAQFQAMSAKIRAAFGGELLAIHHVGSTAIPGLAAKPEIDLLVEVFAHRNEAARDAAMALLGYVRGSQLSDDHHFYRRDVEGVRTHKVHVCLAGHAQIERMLRFRDRLRDDAALRQQYQDLKLGLEAGNVGGIGEYLAGKAPFIDDVMSTMQVAPEDSAETRATKACPVLLRTIDGRLHGLAFRHPLAGIQVVKGSIKPGEPYADAAVRELAEESGVKAATATQDLGTWASGFQHQVWSFQRCEAPGPLPATWTFETADDGGRVFDFFWHPLHRDLPSPCHWLFQAAWRRIGAWTRAG